MLIHVLFVSADHRIPKLPYKDSIYGLWVGIILLFSRLSQKLIFHIYLEISIPCCRTRTQPTILAHLISISDDKLGPTRALKSFWNHPASYLAG